MAPARLDEVVSVAALALGSHLIFQLVPPRMPEFCLTYILACISWLWWNLSTRQSTLLHAISNTFTLATIYNVVILSSIGCYRLFFHRVSKFKGPLWPSLSKWGLFMVDVKGKRPEYLQALHAKYGDIVRTGPREISINDPSVLPAVHGSSSTMIKGPWYKVINRARGPRTSSLLTEFVPADRRSRRRIWDGAFSTKALKSYEDQVLETTMKVMNKFQALADKQETVALDTWSILYSFDIMGQVGFSKGFGAVDLGHQLEPMQVMHEVTRTTMAIGCVSWTFDLLNWLPSPTIPFDKWTEQAVIERKQQGATRPDIFSHLLAEDRESGFEHSWDELKADSNLTVIAGSDTVSGAITMTLFFLLTHPEVLSKLRAELDSVFSSDEEAADLERLEKNCPFLDACINETLRLYPPVASGAQRETQDSEVVMNLRDGSRIVVPPFTNVTVPAHTLHRDPRNFSPAPNQFRPERWLKPQEEEAFNRNAFIAFGYGPAACVGKRLAWMEMRLYLANSVRKFDIQLDPSFDPDKFREGVIDTYTTRITVPLPVKLQARRA